GGISVVLIPLPFTKRNRSSCGRTLRSKLASWTPEFIGVAEGAPAQAASTTRAHIREARAAPFRMDFTGLFRSRNRPRFCVETAAILAQARGLSGRCTSRRHGRVIAAVQYEQGGPAAPRCRRSAR